MACVVGVDPPALAVDALIPFTNTTAAGIDFVTNGTGIRDFDTTIIPASIPLGVPFAPINAYIYINTLQANTFLVPSVDISRDGGPFTTVPVSLLGRCGNTCWLSADDGTHFDGAHSPQGIFNFVYFADLTGLGIITVGNHTYTVKVPGIAPLAGPPAIFGSDQPRYPGCAGGQGIELLATFNDGSGATRHFRIFHGAKLLTPDGPNPNWPGGSTSYTVSFPSVAPYFYKPIAFAAVGDSQTTYSDSFCFNGTCAIPNPYGSVWQDKLGGMSNLLGQLTLGIDGSMCVNPTTNNATIDVAGGTECLCWFLLVYLAGDVTGQCTCDPGPSLPPGELGNASVPGAPFRNLFGGYDYVINGIGTRNKKIDTDPGVFPVIVPGVPVEAYLYWNVIVDESIDADTANLNGTPHVGTMIGKVGNTCWGPPQMDGSNPCIDCGIRNQVWRADVTTQVQTAIPLGGLFPASVTIDNVGDPVQPICTKASDEPRYPGCNGSQGIVLLVIYESPCGSAKRLQVYDGAVLLVAPANQPTYGGIATYELDVNLPEAAGCAKIALAIGDAQTFYQDSFLWNGTPLPTVVPGSYANPYVGKLMHLAQHQVQATPGINTVTGTTTLDCLCWFLFVVETYPLICDPNDCGPNACHIAAPFDQLYQFERRVGDIDFVLGGAGIRDWPVDVIPVTINITVPGPVIKAYLYWNVIGGGNFCPDLAIFNGVDVPGNIIGCCGNTCWSAWCTADNSDHGQETANNNILNKVWFQDVTALVPGTGSYTVKIPGVHLSGVIATKASDSPYYPGCCGGQGVALLVIYGTPPQITNRPRHKCVVANGHGKCVDDATQIVTETETREIIIWHGAKLLKCDPCQPATIGGSNSYTIPWKTKYTWKPKIATAVGDAQSKYADSFYYNGILLPPQPSYFNPLPAGNLLHVKTEYLPGHITKCDCGGALQENNVRAFTPDDCLCWFLFVWSGSQKCIKPLVSKGKSFTSPPTMMMSLWNPNPPDCCPVRLPCCGQICLPDKLIIGITAPSLQCSCLANQKFTMTWNNAEQKYLLQPTTVCGCTLFGWLYCVGTQWTLYLSLSEGSTLCSDGVNTNFPINCSPFGGVGGLILNPVNACSCNCVTDLLTVSVSPG